MSTPQGATIAPNEQTPDGPVHPRSGAPDVGDKPVSDKVRNAVIAGGIGIAVVFGLLGFGAGYVAGGSSSSNQGPGMNMPGGGMSGGGMGGGMGQMPGGSGQPGQGGGMGQVPGGAQGGMGQMPGGQQGQTAPTQTAPTQTAPTQGSTTS
ncbi:hypothetical protein [Gordonia insulae]|uniref:Uncharacterized protein n=1 Tax=Gordonia insulae TaxID=2420509 RepID=A0A3G8JP12_9ACTN|nr:hypothetical protein [Gordonia insulae]AZG46199.1 hypothetical protein D7316_02800 [Gordonia insulae]